MEYRRSMPRQRADSYGICHIEGESVPGWRGCRVIDISMHGLGITMHHFWPSELTGRRIFVDAPVVADSVNIRLEGVITNAEPSPGGVIRVGIKFDEVSESELAITTLLSTMMDRDLNENLPRPAVAVTATI